jgi:transposase
VSAAIESMNGARFVHDTLEMLGWDVEIADAQKVKGLAPLACKTDRIDARVLAELSRRDLVPAIWLPDPSVRAERELARYRLHLVRHRTMFKNNIHATLIAFGKPCPVSDLFGVAGRKLLQSLKIPEPWHVAVVDALRRIDDLDEEIDQRQKQLGYTIASEIGDINRFSSPAKLVGYTGLCPRVYQSGGKDHRGPLAKNGPRYLRWALIEAATHAARHPAYAEHYQRTAKRLGKQRGKKVARVEVARKLAEAIWHMCTTNRPFTPARSHVLPLAA